MSTQWRIKYEGQVLKARIIDNREIQLGSEWVLRTDVEERISVIVTSLAIGAVEQFLVTVEAKLERYAGFDAAPNNHQFVQHEFRKLYRRVDFHIYERELQGAMADWISVCGAQFGLRVQIHTGLASLFHHSPPFFALARMLLQASACQFLHPSRFCLP